MAVTSFARDGVSTYGHYNKMSAGNVSASGVFAFADGSLTYRVSSDGLTWTGYSLLSTSPNELMYFPLLQKWIFTSQTAGPFVASSSVTSIKQFGNRGLSTGSVRWHPPLSTGDSLEKLYVGSNAIGAEILDMVGRYRYLATATAAMNRPAWDGGTTWAVAIKHATQSSYRYTTGQGVSGDGIMPFENNGAGSGGWSTWATYTPPTDSLSDLFYWQGYWFAFSNTTQAVYRTANIATATPTWTTVGTLSGQSNAFFIVANNEMWILNDNAVGTIYKIATPTAAITNITLPASKAPRNIAYGNGAWVVFCGDGTVLRSTTGLSGSFASVSTGSASIPYGSSGAFGVTT